MSLGLPNAAPDIFQNANQSYGMHLDLEDTPLQKRQQVEALVRHHTNATMAGGPHHLVLEMDFEHLMIHIRETPVMLAHLGAQHARLIRIKKELERDITEVRSEVFLALKGIVENPRIEEYCNRHRIKRDALGVEDRKHLLECDEEVRRRERHLLKIVELEHIVAVLIDALKKKASFIPGLQGTENAIRNGENNRSLG